MRQKENDMSLALFTIAGASISADIVVLIVLLVFAIIGFIRGFLTEALQLVATIASFLIAALFCAKLAGVIIDGTSLDETIASWFVGSFPSDEVTLDKLPEVLVALKFPSFINTAAIEYAQSLGTETVIISEVMSATLAKYVVIALSFLILSLAVKIICAILKWVFKLIKKIPGIGFIDRLFGIVIGIAKGAVYVCAVFYILQILPLDALSGIKEEIATAPLCKFLSEYNLFTFIFSLVKF